MHPSISKTKNMAGSMGNIIRCIVRSFFMANLVRGVVFDNAARLSAPLHGIPASTDRW
jgi:hypothetical protein